MTATLHHVGWALALVAGGRATLALLPVGDAGLRRALDPVSTLAPSAVAGLAVAGVANDLAGTGGLAPFAAPALWALVALVLGACVLARLGPAGIVPRHPRVEAPLPRALAAASWAAWATTALLFAWGAAPTYAYALLAAWLVEGGLGRARLAPVQRRLAALLALAAAVALGADAALVFALAVPLHGIGWVRCADRRDLALAAVAAVGLATVAEPLVAGLLLALVLVLTRRPRLALPGVALGLVGLALVAFVGPAASPFATPRAIEPWLVGGVLGALVLVAARVTDRGAPVPAAA